MATFNPARALIRNAWETTPGVIVSSGWHDHEMVSEELTEEYPTILPESITRAGQRPRGLPSKIRPGGAISVEWDPEGLIHYIANLQRQGSVDNPGAGDTYIHKLAPSETDIAFANTMAVEVWRDDGQGKLFRGCRVNELTWEVAPEGFLVGTIGIAPERGDIWAYASREDAVGGTDPAFPDVRGVPRYDIVQPNATQRYLWLEVTDVTGSVVTFGAQMQADDVTPPTLGATEFEVTVGLDSQGRPRWTEIILDDATRLGTRDRPTQVYISAVANYAVGQQFVFALDREEWVPSYPSVPKFNEIFCAILLGDTYATAEEYEIDSFSLTATRPAEPKFAIGGRYAKRTKERGQREIGGSFSREYLDRNLQARLDAGEPFWMVMRAYSGEEIDQGYEHSLEFISGVCVLGGTSPTVGGQDSMDESYDFTCHPSDDATYADDLTVLAVNTIANLTV